MFARLDENQAMTLQDIKETKCYGRVRPYARKDNVKPVYPPQTKFAGGIKIIPAMIMIHLQEPGSLTWVLFKASYIKISIGNWPCPQGLAIFDHMDISHDIPWFLILFIEELLNIKAFGRRAMAQVS